MENPNVCTYDSPYPIYSMAFSPPPSTSAPLRLAVGSFIEGPTNHIAVLSSDNTDSFSFQSPPSISFDHPYPATKLMFHPRNLSLLASSAECLRIWSISSDSTTGDLHSILSNSRSGSEYCAPLTSFDWNEFEPRRIGTCSIDTTCTVWDAERCVVETQLIAHDKEVYDIAWGEAGVFASVSADGSVRIFDLRDKEHSTIVYESLRPDTPLLRLAWNKVDLRYMATTLMDSSKVIVLDIRSPAMPVAELQRHTAAVNAVAWAPQSGRHLCSAGDDGQALIWELPNSSGAAGVGAGSGVVGGDGIDPALFYSVPAEINQLQWSVAYPDWIGIAFANKVQLLRV